MIARTTKHAVCKARTNGPSRLVTAWGNALDGIAMSRSELDQLSDVASPLGTRNLLLRLAAIGVVVEGIAASFLYAGGWLTPPRVIDRFQQVNGPHPGFRRNHAKGVGFAGYFESNGNGAALSKAAIFA